MPNNEKTAAEEKIRIVELYLSGKIGYSESGKRAGVDRKTIARWASRYKTEGPAGFLTHGDNRAYGRETKPSAVLNYLAGKGGTESGIPGSTGIG